MKKKILFIYTNYSTFVKTDFEILASEHEVSKYQFKPVRGFLKTAIQLIKQKIFLLFNIWKFDAVFVWFADYHSFLPVLFAKILGKKSFVVIGGYDVANIPELKYGSLSSPLRKILTLFSIRNASLCIPVVENLEKKVKEIAPKSITKTIYTGYQFDLKEISELKKEREKWVLTVSITNNRQRFLIKGLDRFRELAESLPDFKFCVVGVSEEAKQLFNLIPKNMVLLPPLNQLELTEYYLKASFYAQFSRSEGLPNALCEAMLYGCIPMGLDVGGISTAIGKNGLIMNDWNVNAAIDFIQKNHNMLNREVFKKYILKEFNIDKRKVHFKQMNI
jgi:glycosyltransferase involved in cell wall biosynthesis